MLTVLAVLAILTLYKEVLPFLAVLTSLFLPRQPSLPFLAVLTFLSSPSFPRYPYLAVLTFLSSLSLPSFPRHPQNVGTCPGLVEILFPKVKGLDPLPLNERRQDTNPNKKRVKRGLPEEGLTFINIPGVSVGKCKIKKQKYIFSII